MRVRARLLRINGKASAVVGDCRFESCRRACDSNTDRRRPRVSRNIRERLLDDSEYSELDGLRNVDERKILRFDIDGDVMTLCVLTGVPLQGHDQAQILQLGSDHTSLVAG